MFLSALLKSFSQIAREKSRRKSESCMFLAVEAVEERLLLSSQNGAPLFFTGPTNGGGGGGDQAFSNPLTAIPVLNSLPGAPVTIFLDFDGHTETDGSWTNNGSTAVVTPVYDNDGDLTTFSDDELLRIEQIWYRVAEDFSPFNVNVTTVEPTSFNNFEALRVSIGGDGAWLGVAAGGVALLNSFSNNGSNTVFVFTDNLQDGSGRGSIVPTAMNTSHEVGHALGLLHHSEYDANGNKTQEYNPGNNRIGPIMGGAFFSERNVWDNGPADTTVDVLQDDVLVMTRAANQTFRLRPDTYGNTTSTAFNLSTQGANVSISSVIEQISDVDMFRVDADTGPLDFQVEGLNLRSVYNNNNLNFGTNLDVVLTLYNSTGQILAQSNLATTLFASFSYAASQGTYYIGVSSTGEYGSIGQYTLTGSYTPLPTVPTMIGPTGTLATAVPTFQWTVAGNAASYELEVDNLTLGRTAFYTANVTTTTHTPPNQFPQGEFQARVRTVAPNGGVSGWSNYVSFTVDIPAPTEPVITRPQGDIADAFPTFEWNASQDASAYSLWVSNLGTGERVIFRTNNLTTSYTHFSALPDGNYRAWVRAFNTVGEFSAWSKPVDFSIDTPIPVAPTLTAPAAVTASTNPRFVWTAVEGVARYDLWVNNLTTGKPQFLRVENISRTATFFDPPAMPQGNYVAWIRAVNGNGEASPWSAARAFTVDILPPTTPTITGPKGANNSLTVDTVNPTFTWTAATRAVRYDLWVNNMTLGLAQVIRKTDITSTSFTAIANLQQGLHRAFVRGINSAGEVGEWSKAYEFTIDEPTPLVPQIVAPTANPGGSVENANPTFVWTIGTAAPFYELQVDNVSLGRPNVIAVRGLTDTRYTVPTPDRFGEYTYSARVRAYNLSGDVSDWSPAFRFRIDVPSPTTPIIIGPTGTSRDTTPTFNWVHTASSFRYEILVRDTERNETIVLNVLSFQLSPNGDEAIYTLPDASALRPSTYRFWIRAFNSLGQSSSWSTAQTFVISASLDPALLAPETNRGLDEPILASLLFDEFAIDRVIPQQPVSENVVEMAVPVDPERSEQPVRVSSTELSWPETRLTTSADDSLVDAAMLHLFDPSSGLLLDEQA